MLPWCEFENSTKVHSWRSELGALTGQESIEPVNESISDTEFIPKLSLSELSSDDNEDEMDGACGIYGGEERCRCILHSKIEYLEYFISPDLMQIIADQTTNYKTVEQLSLPVCYAMSSSCY
jgi:hypothetical protein